MIENRSKGCRIMILSPPEDAGGHEVYDIRLDSGAELDSRPHGPGTMEQLTVLEGQVTVQSGTATEALSPGDTARYAADVTHKIATTDGPARVFLIVKSS